MDLTFFFEDEAQTIEKSRDSDYRIDNAISEVSNGLSIENAATKLYTCRMWQWYDIYKQWVLKGSLGEMFSQPSLEQATSEVYNHFRQLFKANREQTVSNLTVEVDGMVFDADENSQRRMTTAIISAIDDVETTPWVLADNSVVNLNRIQLTSALRASGLAMAAVWIAP